MRFCAEKGQTILGGVAAFFCLGSEVGTGPNCSTVHVMKPINRVYSKTKKYFVAQNFEGLLPSEQPENETSCKEGKKASVDKANEFAKVIWNTDSKE